MRLRLHRTLLLTAVLLHATSCVPATTRTSPSAFSPPETGRENVVYVLTHGWHVGIALSRADIPDELWPEKVDFLDAAYLEVGWGDETFYRADEITLTMALRAALTPTRSVLHVVGLDRPVVRFFPTGGIVELRLSDHGLRDLVQYVHDTIDRHSQSRAPALGRGLYGNSRFYRATGTYSLLNNCNHWAARALVTAGVPVEPRDAMTAGETFRQVTRLGFIVRPAP